MHKRRRFVLQTQYDAVTFSGVTIDRVKFISSFAEIARIADIRHTIASLFTLAAASLPFRLYDN